MLLSVNRTLLNYYFKSVTHIFFDMHITKNYVQTFKEDLCHALIVEKSFLHQILSTIVFKSRNTIIPGERSQHYRPDTIIPLSKERLDMAAYTFSYHTGNGCAVKKDSFWGNKNVWELLVKFRFEEHSAYHKASCFKKGCEC